MSNAKRQFKAARTTLHPVADAHPWHVFDYENSQVARCPCCGKLAYFSTRTEALIFEREANAMSGKDWSAKTGMLGPFVHALRLADEVISALLKEPQEHQQQARADLDLIRDVLGSHDLKAALKEHSGAS